MKYFLGLWKCPHYSVDVQKKTLAVHWFGQNFYMVFFFLCSVMLGLDLFHFQLLHSRGRLRYSFGVGQDRLWGSIYRKLGVKQQNSSVTVQNKVL